MKISRYHVQAPGNQFILAIIYIALFYYSYRYPLQINSSTTSPTYSDTPTYLQVGKFVILSLMGVVFIATYRLKFNQKLLFLSLPLFVQQLIAVAKVGVTGNPIYFDYSFWPLLGLLLSFCKFQMSFDSVLKLIRNLFFLSVFVTATEFFLYKFYGRLPALAYEDSLDVRFGSFLDDPNGFAPLCALFLGWISFRFKRISLAMMFSVDVIMVFLTQSFTGIGTISFLILASLLNSLKRDFTAVYLFTFVAIGALSNYISSNLKIISSLISGLLSLKTGSVAQHVSVPFGQFINQPQYWMTLGDWSGNFYEVGWWNLFLLNGIWNFLWIAFVITYFTIQSYKKFNGTRTPNEKAVYGSILYLDLFIMIGSLNIPFFGIFPINFLFFLLNGMVITQKFVQPKVSVTP